MTRIPTALFTALTVLCVVLAQPATLAAQPPTDLPAPNEKDVRPFPLVNPITHQGRRGLTFQTPEAFTVEPRGVTSVVRLPSGSTLTVHAFGCEPTQTPLDPNYIVEALDPAMAALFPRLTRFGEATTYPHPAGPAARFRYQGHYGEGDKPKLVIGVVYALVADNATALFITECPPDGELPSMEIMQPIFNTFTLSSTASQATTTSTSPSNRPKGVLPNSQTLASGAHIAYPEGFTPTVDHNEIRFKPAGDAPGPTIQVIDRLHGGAYPATVIRTLLPELQNEFPTLHRTEDPIITSSTISARLVGQRDGQEHVAVLRAVVQAKRTLRIVLSGTPEQVRATEPFLDTMIAESMWPAPENK